MPAEFAGEISLEAHQKAADYSTAQHRASRMVHAVFDAAVLLVLTFGGLLQFFGELRGGWFANPLLQGAALIALFVVVTSLIDLPFSYYRTFVIEARFGFNKMTPRACGSPTWSSTPRSPPRFGLPLVLAVLWLMGATGDYWWLYVWLVWVAFSLFVMAIYPTFIAPLFNKFSPMQEGSLKARIEQLLAKCGFHVERAVRDGRLAPQQPRQRLLHRLRQDQAHRVLRHAALAPERGRGRGGARARAGALQAAPRDPAHGLDLRA